jgi:DNA-binding MarR family transcriptional regulator/GNAT superfamily N-acetyltransferase
MNADAVATLRRFNRTWSQRVGVLEDSFLGSGRPLGPSRLLFEIGQGAATIQQLRGRLGLDSGYLSRLLRQLEGEGLVEVRPDPADGRRRVVHLTAAGRTARQELDAASDELARRLVDPLGERQRRRLTEALETAERIARAATVSLDTMDPRAPSARAAIGAYFAELDRRFSDGFDPGDEVSHDAATLSPPHGMFVVAVSDGEPVACGGVRRLDPRTSELKRMWVHEEWRGLGLGGRMLRHLELESARLGLFRVRLDTNSSLDEAIAMYAAAGYEPIERYGDNPYAQRWFEKTLPSG